MGTEQARYTCGSVTSHFCYLSDSNSIERLREREKHEIKRDIPSRYFDPKSLMSCKYITKRCFGTIFEINFQIMLMILRTNMCFFFQLYHAKKGQTLSDLHQQTLI